MTRKKNHSTMSPSDFIHYTNLLGGKYKTVGELIGRSAPIVSQYASGLKPITKEVATRLLSAVDDRRKQLANVPTMAQRTITDGDMLDFNFNQRTAIAREPQAPRLTHRRVKPDNTTFPTYRLTYDRMKIYLEALNAWAVHMRAAHTRVYEPHLIGDCKAELLDIQCLAEFARGAIQRGAPYDVCITKAEWLVVSRALRHLYAQDKCEAANALYQHWRVHKGSGFPYKKSTTT